MERECISYEVACYHYDAFLDEYGPVVIDGITFDRSRIMKQLDPIAYRCGVNDYTDACGYDITEY